MFSLLKNKKIRDAEFPIAFKAFSLLKNKKIRDAGFQIAFVGFLVLIIVTFIVTARNNLEAQGLTSGFDFLDRATGWSINFSLVEYSTGSTYSRAILVGFLNSMFVGAISPWQIPASPSCAKVVARRWSKCVAASGVKRPLESIHREAVVPCAVGAAVQNFAPSREKSSIKGESA